MSETISQPTEPIAVTAAQLVRATPCSLCWALPGTPCRGAFLGQPPADHLARWLDGYGAGLVSKEELAEVFREVVVITKWQVVPERAA